MTDRPPILVGVGVGPGDPELVTLKACRVLAASDVILVPSTEASGSGAGRAETIVAAAVPEAADRIVRVPFVMGDRSGVTRRRSEAWDASARAALEAFETGARTVSFATVGDPSVYSTFSYLAASVVARRPDVAVEVVPGITAMQALAAASRIPLVEGDEVLAIVPLKAGVEQLAEVTRIADTCVVYKPARHLAALRELLGERAAEAVVGIDVGLPDERVVPLSDVEDAPYFTSVLVPARRRTIGGRL